MQLSASFYLNIYNIYIHVFVIHACKTIQKAYEQCPYSFPTKKKNIGSTHHFFCVQASDHPNFSLLTLVDTEGSLPGNSPNKGMLQLVMKGASKNLDYIY